MCAYVKARGQSWIFSLAFTLCVVYVCVGERESILGRLAGDLGAICLCVPSLLILGDKGCTAVLHSLCGCGELGILMVEVSCNDLFESIVMF